MGHNILQATQFFIPEESSHYEWQVSWLTYFQTPSRINQWY